MRLPAVLKLNYTEMGLSLERVEVSLDVWIAQWVQLSVRTGRAVHVEPSRAALLVPVGDALVALKEVLANEAADIFSDLRVIPVDEENAEISLRGLWISQDLEAEEGIFAVALGDRAEAAIAQLWQATPYYVSHLA